MKSVYQLLGNVKKRSKGAGVGLEIGMYDGSKRTKEEAITIIQHFMGKEVTINEYSSGSSLWVKAQKDGVTTNIFYHNQEVPNEQSSR